MNQWHDDTLVAIQAMDIKRFKVLELPARQTQIIMSKRTFASVEQAEQYIDNEYNARALTVQPDDIYAEADIRQFKELQDACNEVGIELTVLDESYMLESGDDAMYFSKDQAGMNDAMHIVSQQKEAMA